MFALCPFLRQKKACPSFGPDLPAYAQGRVFPGDEAAEICGLTHDPCTPNCPDCPLER